ncbi:MAG: response regulator [Gemmatimonadetes bacterium]|nr:response regulator [Gemmatimonadota bacterium]
MLTSRPSSVLVVDDEPSLRKLVDRILRHGGYSTLLAANAPDALRLFDQNAPDIGLVLLDWHLPGVSGKEALAALLARRADLRVVIMTGGHEATTDENATKNTISILLKPFTATELMLAVRTVFGA